MPIDWPVIDRWLMGEAWTGSRVPEHLAVLCDEIGPRWSTSAGERRAIEYIRDQFESDGLAKAGLEEFQLPTWAWDRADAKVVETGQAMDLLPAVRCPSFQVSGPIVDAGYGTPEEIELVRSRLKGSIAVVRMGSRPFVGPTEKCLSGDKLIKISSLET